MNEERKNCILEILLILKESKNKGRELTKEQICLIHYLLRNYNKHPGDSYLKKISKLKIFDICDYDFEIENLIQIGLVQRKIERVIAKYSLGERGLNIIDRIEVLDVQLAIKDIFSESITEKNLRRRIIPNVKI